MEQNQIIRAPEVIAMVGMSRTTLWRMEREGTFPKRLQLSTRNVGWKRASVEQWIQERKEVA